MGNNSSPCIHTSIRFERMTSEELKKLLDGSKTEVGVELQAIAWEVFREFVALAKDIGKDSVVIPHFYATQTTLSKKGRSIEEEALHCTKLEECYRVAVLVHARLKSVIDTEKSKKWLCTPSPYLQILIALDKCAGLEPEYEVGDFRSDEIGYLKLAEKLGIKLPVK